MTKADLIKRVAREVEMSIAKTGAVLNAFVDHLTDVLKRGDTLMLPGFGTFHVVKRAGRSGYNPQTKSRMKIAAKRVPKFRPGSGLRKVISR